MSSQQELAQLRRDAAEAPALRAEVERLRTENTEMIIRHQTFSYQSHAAINALKAKIAEQAELIDRQDGQLNFLQTKTAAHSEWSKHNWAKAQKLEKIIEEMKKNAPSTSSGAPSNGIANSPSMPVLSAPSPPSSQPGAQKAQPNVLRTAMDSDVPSTSSDISRGATSSTAPENVQMLQKKPARRAKSPEITEIPVTATIYGTPPVKTLAQIKKEWMEDNSRDRELDQSHFAIYLFNPNGAQEAPQTVRKPHSGYALFVHSRVTFRTESGTKLANHNEGWNVLGKAGQKVWKDCLEKVLGEQNRQINKGWIVRGGAQKRKQDDESAGSRRVKQEPKDDYQQI